MIRSEIPENLTWKKQDIFTNEQAWEEEYKQVEKYSEFDWGVYTGKLSDKNTLLSCLRFIDEISRRVEKLYLYAHLHQHEDMRSSETTATLSKITTLASKLFAEFAFVEPELTAMDESLLQAFIADTDFSDYNYRLSKIAREKAHVLSQKEEKLLALASDVLGDFQSVFSMLDNANLNLPKARLNGEEVQMSHGLYGVALRSGNSEERKEWFTKYYGAYIKLIDAISQTYYSNVKKNVLYKTVRGYNSCLEMALAGEDVDKKVYENLIDATHKALPIMHEYISFRKNALKLDEQHMYDIYMPLVENAEIALPFDKAYDKVIEGLAPLGKDYQALLEKARKERWIDVCENEGKRSGAYSAGTYDAPHPYVLLNYQETTNDMFTIAHEMGHALHTYKSTSAQPYAKADYTIFLAEIASTVNEVLLLKHLYKNAQDTGLKKYLLNYYLDTLRATLFRQTQFAEFEQIAHAKVENGEALTKDCLNELYYGLNKKYYGDGLTHDSEIAYEWARIPHFYSAFYVYKYATGIISAVSIVSKILAGEENAVENYFAFLSSGSETDPVTILKKAGVDLTTTKPFEMAMQEFEDTLNELKKYY